MTLVYVLLAAILGVCGFVAWKMTAKSDATGLTELQKENAALAADVKQLTQEVGKVKNDLEHTQSEKNELVGKNKTMFVQLEALKGDLKNVMQDRDDLRKRVTQFETDEKRRAKEIEQQTTQLSNAQRRFEDEQKRVIREDEERLRHLEEERDRLWANHEMSVIATLTDLCKQPAFSFTGYTNTNLPEGFDGSLKPDFMIDFLGQYVIFDAKVSKAKSMQTYITSQIKSTVEKVKGNDQIYKSIFLVVPTSALQELRTHHHVVDGYNLYVIGPEAVAPILASLKRISMYEFAEQMDPEQRENIVQLIAELDFHINLRNAADLILTKMGTDLLQKAQKVDPALSEEVAMKKAPMNAKASIAAGELKKIVSKLTNQIEEAQQLISPKAPVRKKDLEEAQNLLADTLL